MYLPRLPLQAYAEASAALGGRELTTEERWGAAVGLVAALGDAASALRLAGEPNNQYRLVRVVDILLQSGGTLLFVLSASATVRGEDGHSESKYN